MTSPPATRASPSGPLLIETKLRAPLLREGSLPRTELVELAHASSDCKLVLVCAPAGYGKTTLLSEWDAYERKSRPFAWVSLDPSDQDPARFLAYVVEALGRVQPGFGEDLRAMLRGMRVDLEEVVLPRLINELASLPCQLMLVLEDYHVIKSRESNKLVASLLDHLPDTVQLVISTRSDPRLPLARLRARREMLEIRAHELGFDVEEAGTLLQAELGLELNREEVEVIRTRTEGWPAGLYLTALSLKDHPHPSQAVLDLAGTNRHVLDYLTEEVLERQPPKMRRFLTQTSVLGHFTAPMCDAVTEREDSAKLLRGIEQSNLFLIPLDEQREWYRYHHLFAELLRIELHKSEPESIPILHERAAAWYLRSGAIDDAIRHAAARIEFGYSHHCTGATDEARRILEERLRLAQVSSPPFHVATLVATSFLTLIECEEGHTRRAEELAHYAIENAEAHGLDRVMGELGLVPRRQGELGQDSNNGELDPMPLLTDREFAVLKLLGTELTQRQIGGVLYLSFNTIKSHTRAIYRKLGVSSRKKAVEQAQLSGLIG